MSLSKQPPRYARLPRNAEGTAVIVPCCVYYNNYNPIFANRSTPLADVAKIRVRQGQGRRNNDLLGPLSRCEAQSQNYEDHAEKMHVWSS